MQLLTFVPTKLKELYTNSERIIQRIFDCLTGCSPINKTNRSPWICVKSYTWLASRTNSRVRELLKLLSKSKKLLTITVVKYWIDSRVYSTRDSRVVYLRTYESSQLASWLASYRPRVRLASIPSDIRQFLTNHSHILT